MNSDDFEKKLKRQPMRAIPAEWRAQMLREARLAAAPEPMPRLAWWRKLLWPRPIAWASLAAAWVIIAILHTLTPAVPSLVAQQTPSPRETMLRFAEQRRELAALLNLSAETTAPQKSKSAGPRSELLMSPASA
ncbi:MAG: hypothetical protein HZC54_02660 [Verrucomicrobia bacterium]|nr:hypothetical protein [Verrucomicrobiota bacterium]